MKARALVDVRHEEGFHGVAIGLPQLVFGCRASGVRVWPSPQWIVFTGQSAAESVVFGWLDAVHPDDRQVTMDAWSKASSTGRMVVEHRMRRVADGKYLWHQTRASPLPAPVVLPAGIVDWVGASHDVDALYTTRLALEAAEGKLRTLVEGVPLLLWRSCDMGNWTWASPQWLDFTGQTQEETHGRGWLDAIHPEDRGRAMAAWAEARPHGTLDVEFRVRRAVDGSHLWHRTRSMPVRDAQGHIVEWLGSTNDIQDLKDLQHRQQSLLAALQLQASDLESEIEERKQIEARLLHLAFHDDLTGLNNRIFLMGRLTKALDPGGDQRPLRCTLLLLDLDRFKLVNDSLGHHAGDLLLVEVARRLRECVGPEHTLARFGGDEFAVLLDPGTSSGGAESGAGQELAVRIIAAMRQPIRIVSQEVFTSCSIGVVEAQAGYSSAGEVLRDADIAMYHSKRQRSDAYAIFSQSMRDSAVEALQLRTDLRNAVTRSEFRLHYQPIYDIASGAIVGVEALIRWQHAQRGLLPPSTFIGIAEEIGLIRDIGAWVLRESCGQLRAWCDRFPGLTLYMNANASAAELSHPAYAATVEDALAAFHLDPSRLQLEVTESVFLHQPAVAGAMLNSLRRLGVRVALDDFGTGYSSLNYLDRYEIDTIKIDRSFVTGMPDRPQAASIVKAIVDLGRTMRLSVVAEGVEQPEQLEALRKVGCAFVQGYLLGRPEPVDIITALLETRTRD